MNACTATSKGQVTTPKEIRRQFGIRQGSRIEFACVGDRVELRVKSSPSVGTGSGFGLVRSARASAPADFDPAALPGR